MSTTQDIIRQLRAAGMSQSEIARRIGMPQPRVSRWEAGEVPTGADDALKLAQLLREVEAQQQTAPPAEETAQPEPKAA